MLRPSYCEPALIGLYLTERGGVSVREGTGRTRTERVDGAGVINAVLSFVFHKYELFLVVFFNGRVCVFVCSRAASFGHFEVIQTLSAYGADFSVTTSNGENALHFATKASQLLCIRMLAQRGTYTHA